MRNTAFSSGRSINRYYDPSTDQFLLVDPDVQTTDQPYVYTNDDPLNSSDPLGLVFLPFQEGGGGEAIGGPSIGAAGDGFSNGGDVTEENGSASGSSEIENLKNLNASNLKMTKTVQNEATNYSKNGTLSRPYLNSNLTTQAILDEGTPKPDPDGVPGVYEWRVRGTLNGTKGTYELLVNIRTNTIYHFVFIGGR